MTQLNPKQTTKEIEAEPSRLIVKFSPTIFNPVKKTAFITGITGQDGSYLSEFLLNKGYSGHGLVRRSSLSTNQFEHLSSNCKVHCENAIQLHYGDLTDSGNLVKLINEIKPDEIYNLGAISHVKISLDLSE